jgi:putative PIN family toxin of toxin-antitoxin system
MRVVLDTSVIVAGTRSKSGASRLLLRGALEKRFSLLLSVTLALEYESALKRAEQLSASGGTTTEIDRLLSTLIGVAVPIHRSFPRIALLRDASDEMVLEAALAGQADLLVTFDQRDFETVSPNRTLRIITPRQAVEQIWRNDETK